MVKTPSVVIAALLPRPLRLGPLVLQPLTLGHCLVLDWLENPVLSGVLKGKQLWQAVAVLSKPYSASAAIVIENPGQFQVAVDELQHSVEAMIDEATTAVLVRAHIEGAFAAHKQIRWPKREGEVEVEQWSAPEMQGNGLGWILNMAVRLMKIGHTANMEAVLSIPISQAWAILVGHDIQDGAEFFGEPSYAFAEHLDREKAKEQEAVKENPPNA